MVDLPPLVGGLRLRLARKADLILRLVRRRRGQRLGGQAHPGPPTGWLERDRAASVLALPGNGGLRLEVGDADLAELVHVALEGGRARDLRPQLRRGLDERPGRLALFHAVWFRSAW